MPFRLTGYSERLLALARLPLGLAALAAGVWLLAGQAWRFVLPAPPPALQQVADPAAAATTVAGRHLFGVAAAMPAVAAAPTSYRLLGVIAGRGTQSGAAVLQLNGKATVAVAPGDEVEPGVRLAAIETRSVRLEREGRQVVLSLPEPAAAGGKQ